MQCNKCGSTIKDGLKFCTNCGAKLVLSQSQDKNRYCPNCGELVENESFCTNCGTKLEEVTNNNPDSNNDKTSRQPKKIIPIVIACLIVVLGVGGYFAINYFLNNLSTGLEETAVAESTGSIFVDCSTIYDKVTSVDDAYMVLNNASELFGFDDSKDVLDVEKTDYVNGDTYYRFTQKYKNIPVYGKSVVLSADDKGNVFNISGSYMKLQEDLETEPTLDKEKAKKKVEKQVKKELKNGLTISEPKLVVHCGSEDQTLAWKFDVAGYNKNGDFQPYKIFIGANNGDVIEASKTIVDIQTQKNLKGQNGDMHSVTVEEFETTDNNKNYQLRDKNRNINVNIATDDYYWYKELLDGKTTSTLVCWKNNEEPDRSAVDAMANVSKTYDYYNNVVKYTGLDGEGGEIPVYVHVLGYGFEEDGEVTEKENKNNAFFWAYPDTPIIAFTVMDKGKNEYSDSLDVVAHEYTHGVVYNISGITGDEDDAYERAINEAYADIIGLFVEADSMNGIPDWKVGELRDIENPSNNSYPNNYKQYDVKKGAYYNSSVISHAAYLMWNGVGESNSAIRDVNVLAQLWYDSLYMLNPDSDFSNCRTAVEISAKRLLAKNMLSEEQVECVSLAFDQVGLGKTMLYDTVALNPELHIYGENNSDYYNYHYKVEKISIKNLYYVGKAAETDIQVVEEGDVTEEKSITLSSLNEDSSHACAYRITVSDLSDEPGETQTKFVVVSDAQDAKGVLAFYTDFTPPIKEMMQKVNTALDGVKSVHLSQSTTSDYSVMGSSVSMGITLESDVNLTNGIMHTNMNTKYGGRSISNDIYVKTTGNASDIYMYTSGMWVKQTGISTDDLYKLGNGFEGVEGIKFYLNTMDDAFLENDSDKNNHIISGTIGSAETEEALKKAGLSTLIDQLSDEDEVSEADLQAMLNNLSPMKITFYIDKTTFLPTKMQVDMKDTTDSIYRNLKNIAAKYGESISYSIKSNEAVTLFTQYNNLSEILIPDEAANGTDYKIIK